MDRTLKILKDYPAEDGWELAQGLKAFFRHYNYEKSHQGIGRRKPASLYLAGQAAC